LKRFLEIRFIGVRQFKQHVAVYLHLLAVFAQLLFRALELVVRSHEFDRALGHALLKRRVELTNLAFCPLALLARAERHHSIRQVVGQICILLNRRLSEDICFLRVESERTERLAVRHQRKGNVGRVATR
jgi:hypothetical protein